MRPVAKPGTETRREASFERSVAAQFGYAVLATAALATSLASWSANAASYYVSLSGNDSSSGSIGAPFRTLNKGVSVANGGDTVYVRGGTYTEQAIITRSGFAGAPIRVQPYSGETVVIDGQNRLPGSYDALIWLGGNYIEVSGFEVKNSTRYGVHLQGHHNAAREMNIHHSIQHGLLLRGDFSIAEDNLVWQATLSNNQGGGGGMWGSGIAAGRDPGNTITDNAVIRRNTVFNNWGEGIMSFEANGTLIEDNIIYDNWAANLYLSSTTNTVAQRNLVYATAGNPVGRRACGICMADEIGRDFSSNISVVNNFVHGTITNFTWWVGYPNTYMNNVLIAHNTFVNIVGGVNHVNVAVSAAAHRNVRFVNNIIQQDDGNGVAWLQSGTSGIAFAANLWSKRPPDNTSSGTDIVGNPLLARTGSTAAGQFDPTWFTLTSASPARNRGTVVSEVTEDHFESLRDSTPDIGAHEYGASTGTPPAAPPVAPPASPSGANLALNKSVTVSSSASGAAGSQAVDGNASTQWSSAAVNAAWARVDLGGNYTIDRIRLNWGSSYSRGYTVGVSSDGTNWTTVWYTGTGGGGAVDLTALGASGRYVRVNSWSPSGANGIALSELEVYSTSATIAATNVALNRPATASSTENASFPASNAFDGKTSTRWSSQFSDPQWLQVDLGARYNISRARLAWETASSRSYQLQVSNDAVNWTDIYSTTTGSGGTVDLASVTGVGRYFRVLGTSRNTVWGHSLWEVEVYGTPAP